MDPTQLYSTLPSDKSIRLLRLQCGVHEQPISCSLIVTDDYISTPEYYALSYCWGDVTDTTELICNGRSIPVTKTLYAALHRLREKIASRLVWADAVCINQKNTEERNQQLSIMKQIYIHASSVFIWAGQGDEHSAPSLDLIRSISYGCCKELYGLDSSPASWPARLRKEADRTHIVMNINLAELEEVSRTIWQSFWHFYQSNWFFRVWVIQEVRESTHTWLLCGKEIAWEFVALAASWVCRTLFRNTTRHWKKDHFPSYSGFCNSFFMWESFSTRREALFPALLNLVRRFRSTDPRDKVFALLQHPILQVRESEQRESIGTRHPSGLSSNVSLLPDY